MKLDPDTVSKTLDLLYDKALNGVPALNDVPGFSSVEDMAQDYLKGDGSLEQKIDKLISVQVAKASTSGFVTGLGGVLTLPVMIPANLSSVLYVQLRTIAAIARINGYDVRSDQVKTLCFVCLCGDAAKNILKGTGITLGRKLTEQAIKRLSYEVIKKINQAVGFRLITKFGQTGIVNLGKAIPLAGGIVGGTFDGMTTYTVGKVAKNLFFQGAEQYDEEVHDMLSTDVIENLDEFVSDGKILGKLRQVAATVLGDDDEVLDADAADPRIVEAGLDGDHVSGDQDLVG
jgi:uncharacterized protein (DUF697 family)